MSRAVAEPNSASGQQAGESTNSTTLSGNLDRQIHCGARAWTKFSNLWNVSSGRCRGRAAPTMATKSKEYEMMGHRRRLLDSEARHYRTLAGSRPSSRQLSMIGPSRLALSRTLFDQFSLRSSTTPRAVFSGDRCILSRPTTYLFALFCLKRSHPSTPSYYSQ